MFCVKDSIFKFQGHFKYPIVFNCSESFMNPNTTLPLSKETKPSPIDLHKPCIDKQDSTFFIQQATSSCTFLFGVICVISLFFVTFVAIPYLLDKAGKYNCTGCIKVDKAKCRCDCFDGWNKGDKGRGGYKYLYINSEWPTFYIMMIIVFYVAAFQRAGERMVRLLINGKLAIGVGIVLLMCIHPNYYNFWAHVNYINDESHQLELHQVR